MVTFSTLSDVNQEALSTSLCNAAEKYAEEGYEIFPVKENSKEPATKKGFYNATNDPEKIKNIWKRRPNNNIGLPMAMNGLVCIDIDNKAGKVNGFETLEAYRMTHGLPELPPTVEADTPNNGKHLIYVAPPNFKPAGILTAGVDIIFNGYIIITPSKIDEKQYKWANNNGLLEREVAELPEDWIKHLIKPESLKQELNEPDVNCDYPESNAEKVAEQCQCVSYAIDNSRILSEPLWKFMLVGVISYCKDGREYVHKWSEDYERYTFKETEKKIDYALKFGKPTTCKGIQEQCGTEYCKDCIHSGKITSPIVLGYEEQDYARLNEIEIEFPVEVFPDKIRELILNASYVMDAPKEYFAACILSMTGFLINSQAFLKIKKTDWCECATFWIALVGEPGKKKKTPVYKFIKGILEKIDEKLDSKYREELAKYSRNKLTYDIDLKNWQKDRTTNKDRETDPPNPPEEPFRTLIYTSDTTTEALAYNQQKNPHSIGIMRDELAGFVEGFDKYSGKKGNDRQYYLSSFSGDEFVVSRKKEGSFKVKPYHNILGSIQPAKVKELLLRDLQVTDGFTERFLCALTNYTKRAKSTDDEIDEGLKAHLTDLMQDIYNYFSRRNVTYYELDKDAKRRLFDIFDEADRDTLDENNAEILQSYIEKIKTYIPRIALVLHCLNDYEAQYVQKDTIEAAFAVAKYFINCFVSLTIDSTRFNSGESYLIQWLKLRNISNITPSKLHLSNRARFKTISIARKYLHCIANSGYGRIVPTKNGGEKWVR